MQDQPSHNSLWFLMARSLSGEATALEEQQLHQIISQDISLQQQYDLMKRMWHAQDTLQTENINEEEKEHVTRILKLAKTETNPAEEIPVIQIRSKRKYLYAFSAVAVVMIMIPLGWVYVGGTSKAKNTIDDPHNQDLVAENGSRTRTLLPDGSVIWLNAGSHVSFNKDFTGKTREVTLDGEAYFDVVKQPERPFIVHVSGYDVKVLGTAFNIRSYSEDKTIETTLIRGLVQVSKQGTKEQKPIILHPNEKLTVEKFAAENTKKLPEVNTPAANQDTTDYKITALNTALHEDERIETAWVYNRLQFRGESFTTLADKLERWYNVKIFFDDERASQLNFTGSFQQETVEEAFAALKAAKTFNYEINGKEIHVRSIK